MYINIFLSEVLREINLIIRTLCLNVLIIISIFRLLEISRWNVDKVFVFDIFFVFVSEHFTGVFNAKAIIVEGQ